LGEHEKAMETCLQLELPWHAEVVGGDGGRGVLPKFFARVVGLNP